MDVYALSMLILPFMFLYGIAIGLWNEYVDKKQKESEKMQQKNNE